MIDPTGGRASPHYFGPDGSGAASGTDIPVNPANQDAAQTPSGAQRDAITFLDELLARPNDWPLDDTLVGFWVSRANLLRLRARLVTKEGEK